MLKQFATWFVIFGLSFLVSDVFGWTEQGKAFFVITMLAGIILIIIAIALMMTVTQSYGSYVTPTEISFITILASVWSCFVVLFATWVATKLFDVDFYVAFQIMTFGQCLCTKNKKKDD